MVFRKTDPPRSEENEALVRCRVACFTPPGLFERALAERSTGRLGRAIREIAVPLCSGVPLFLNLRPSELEEGWLVRTDDPIAWMGSNASLANKSSSPPPFAYATSWAHWWWPKASRPRTSMRRFETAEHSTGRAISSRARPFRRLPSVGLREA
jgi:hypothetical protein